MRSRGPLVRMGNVEEDRLPVSNIYEARTATEMIVAVFESQRTSGPVTFPLENRRNPLTMLDSSEQR